jgi:Domain of unknown function (DUF5615)
VASFYLDHNVPQFATFYLRQRGHIASTARAQGLAGANDAEQLRFAARQNSILVSRNREDFELLHAAWISWAQEWRVVPTPQHAGILVIPDRWLADQVATELDQFVRAGLPLPNALFVWRAGRGWERYVVSTSP